MRYLIILSLFIFPPAYGQNHQESAQNFFLHLDYAHQALKISQENPREDVREKELKFYKHHIKQAIKLQKKMSKSFPYEELPAADRLFSLQFFTIWGGILQRNLGAPNFSRFSADYMNASLQKDRLQGIAAQLEPRNPLYSHAALIAADDLYFGVQNLKRYVETSADTAMPAKVRKKALSKAKKSIPPLNKSAALLAETFPAGYSDNITDIVLSRYAEAKPFSKKELFNEERLREAEYLLKKLQKAFYLNIIE